EHLRVLEQNLDFAREPPAARQAVAGTAIVGIELSAKSQLRASVSPRGRLLLEKNAVDHLVVAALLGDREQIRDRRQRSLRRVTHIFESTLHVRRRRTLVERPAHGGRYFLRRIGKRGFGRTVSFHCFARSANVDFGMPRCCAARRIEPNCCSACSIAPRSIAWYGTSCSAVVSPCP